MPSATSMRNRIRLCSSVTVYSICHVAVSGTLIFVASRGTFGYTVRESILPISIALWILTSWNCALWARRRERNIAKSAV